VIRFALISKMVISSISSPGARLTVTDGVRTLTVQAPGRKDMQENAMGVATVANA
jgi:hypothetical protein